MANLPGIHNSTSDHPLSPFSSHPLYTAVKEALALIRPMVQVDGGSISLKDITDDGVVVVALGGACTSCSAASGSTLPGIERILRDRVPGVTGLRDVAQHEGTNVIVRQSPFIRR